MKGFYDSCGFIKLLSFEFGFKIIPRSVELCYIMRCMDSCSGPKSGSAPSSWGMLVGASGPTPGAGGPAPCADGPAPCADCGPAPCTSGPAPCASCPAPHIHK